jgi:dihydrofolate synthase / folylpolyglutamate synthase
MHQLNALLGMPQHRFASIHVVGTNGKSSVTRMTAALLQGHGLRTGACVSPHSERWSERVRIGGEEIEAGNFAAAVERAAAAAEALNRNLPDGEVATQFELATAATFVAFASAGVDVAVIEAGLGGRLDATNTIPSRVTVLTSVGLDHTEWLGESVEEIAAEKLAVLRDHSVLVVGRVGEAVRSLAERVAAERGAQLIVAPDDPGSEVSLAPPGRFQRRNFALACAAAEAFSGRVLDGDVVSAVAGSLRLPGRLERVGDEPPVYLDVAHNPDGAAAVAEALPQVSEGRPVVACLAVLAEKDVDGIVGALVPAIDHALCTELPGFPSADGPKTPARVAFSARRRSVEAEKLAQTCERAGLAAAAEPNFAIAVRRGRALAAERDGVLIVAGSHYALAPAREALRSVRGPQRRI